MKILMVLTSHDQLGNTGRKTGFWLEELSPRRPSHCRLCGRAIAAADLRAWLRRQPTHLPTQVPSSLDSGEATQVKRPERGRQRRKSALIRPHICPR